MIEFGHAADAFPVLDRCVETASQTEELETLALALYWRASCAFDLEDLESARMDAGRGVRVARRAGSQLAELLNLRITGSTLADLGHFERAVAASESALMIATNLGVAAYELAALHALAFTCSRMEHERERAVNLCLRRIQLSRKLGDVRGEGHAYGVLGDTYYGLGKYELAVESLLRALPIFRDHQAHRHHALCLMKLGYAYERMRTYPLAIDYLEEGLVRFRELRLPRKAEQAQEALDRCRAAVAAVS
jgi:tetratricopeptide (TPR) repeat protein